MHDTPTETDTDSDSENRSTDTEVIEQPDRRYPSRTRQPPDRYVLFKRGRFVVLCNTYVVMFEHAQCIVLDVLEVKATC